jgi:hypothetical protein
MTPSSPLSGKTVRGSRTGRPVMALLDLLGRRGSLRLLWELRDGHPQSFRVPTRFRRPFSTPGSRSCAKPVWSSWRKPVTASPHRGWSW